MPAPILLTTVFHSHQAQLLVKVVRSRLLRTRENTNRVWEIVPRNVHHCCHESIWIITVWKTVPKNNHHGSFSRNTCIYLIGTRAHPNLLPPRLHYYFSKVKNECCPMLGDVEHTGLINLANSKMPSVFFLFSLVSLGD